MFSFLHHKVNKVRLTLLLALAFTTLAAGVFRTPSIVFMAALLMSAPLLGITLGRLGGRRLKMTRALPESGTVGDVVESAFTLQNLSRWPALLVHVRAGETSDGEQDHEDAPICAVDGGEQIVPVLAGGTQFCWRQSWELRRRGVFEISPARASALDPLELYARLAPKTRSHEIVVLPRPIRVNHLGLLDGSTAGDTLPHYATVVADALDFHGVRAWRPGEAIRRVHWKSTARTGQLHVIEWEENTASDLAILLDTQASTIAGDGNDNTLETAITLAASMAAHLLENGYRLQLYYWQPSSAARPGAPAEKTAGDAKLRLVCHETGNANGLGPTLNLLSRLQPTHNEKATLAYLASKVRPLLPPGRRQLLMTSTLADIESALEEQDTFSARGATPCRALVMDAVSFDARVLASLPARVAPFVRVVRRGESLGAVLEQS